jgi:transposase
MTQEERDRLVALKKAKKKVITQREAAEELGLSIRQVKRLLYGLKKRGDKAVVHGLGGKPSNRRMEERVERQAVKILSAPVYQGFGPTLAAEYLEKKHGIQASKETVRAVDDPRQAMGGQEREGQRGARLAAAAGPMGRAGAVGHQ